MKIALTVHSTTEPTQEVIDFLTSKGDVKYVIRNEVEGNFNEFIIDKSGNRFDMETGGSFGIENFEENKDYKKGDLVYFENGEEKGIYRCENDTDKAPYYTLPSSFAPLGSDYKVVTCYLMDTAIQVNQNVDAGESVIFYLGDYYNSTWVYLCENVHDAITQDTTIYDCTFLINMDSATAMNMLNMADTPLCEDVIANNYYFFDPDTGKVYNPISCPYTDYFEPQSVVSEDWKLISQLSVPQSIRIPIKYSTEEVVLGEININPDYPDLMETVYAKSFYYELDYWDSDSNTENVYFDLTELNIKQFLEVSGTKQTNMLTEYNSILSHGETIQMLSGVNYSVTNQSILHTFTHNAPVGIQNKKVEANRRQTKIFFSIVYLKDL